MRPRQQHIIRKEGYNHLLFLPKDYGLGKKWPLILFLHGAGEKGSNLNLLKATALPKMLEEMEDFPFVVSSPQCPRGFYWSALLIIQLLEELLARYKIDEDRVYLTGISMGAFGAWTTAIEQPWRFAALAPICGGGDPKQADRLKDVPIWAFHGLLDKVVPVSESTAMVDAVRKAGGDVRFTIYPDAGHDAWTRTYENPELYTWFLSRCRKSGLECPEPGEEPGQVAGGPRASV